mmetsp:Transcript_7164/g.18248  ORF Transcript_7164/g.18248 Transcript_7164/m.18248 type:complete len:290 (-) Transcript_7164:21-890(-)
MGTTKEMTSRPMTTLENTSRLSLVSALVLNVRFLFFSKRTGGPGSSLPSSTATMRSTEEVSASPNFSSSRLKGMFLLRMESSTSLPTALRNLGPPTTDPSLVFFTSRIWPFMSPSARVGYQLSNTLSPKAKGSCSNTSLRMVTTFTWYPVFSSRSLSLALISPAEARDSSAPSSTMYPLPDTGAGVCRISSSDARAAGAPMARVAAAPSPTTAAPNLFIGPGASSERTEQDTTDLPALVGLAAAARRRDTALPRLTATGARADAARFMVQLMMYRRAVRALATMESGVG